MFSDQVKKCYDMLTWLIYSSFLFVTFVCVCVCACLFYFVYATLFTPLWPLSWLLSGCRSAHWVTLWSPIL